MWSQCTVQTKKKNYLPYFDITDFLCCNLHRDAPEAPPRIISFTWGIRCFYGNAKNIQVKYIWRYMYSWITASRRLKRERFYGIYGVLIVVMMVIQSVWDMTPCRIVNSCWRFGRACCLNFERPRNYSSWTHIMGAASCSDTSAIFNYQVIQQKGWIFITIDTRTSNVT